MASKEKGSTRSKPPVPVKSQAVLAFSKQLNALRHNAQYHSDPEDDYDDILPYRLSILSKEPEPSCSESVPPATNNEKKLTVKPKPPPKPKFSKLQENIYDDVVVFRKKPPKPPLAPKPPHLRSNYKVILQQVQTDSESPRNERTNCNSVSASESDVDEGVYTDASSFRPGVIPQGKLLEPISQNYKQVYKTQLEASECFEYELPYNMPEMDKSTHLSHVFTGAGTSKSLQMATDSECIQLPFESDVADNGALSASEEYDYPQHSPVKKAPQSTQGFEYDYTVPTMSLTQATSVDSSNANNEQSQNVSAGRQCAYDYAYQPLANPCSKVSPSPQHGTLASSLNEYDYIEHADRFDGNPIGSLSPCKSKASGRTSRAGFTSSSFQDGIYSLASEVEENDVEGLTIHQNRCALSGLEFSSTPQDHKTPSIASSLSDENQMSASPQELLDHDKSREKVESFPKRKVFEVKQQPLSEEAKQLAASKESSHSNSGYKDEVPDVHTYEEGHKGEPDYENLADVRVQALELPKQMRQRTKRIVRGPTKKKLHQSIKQRKNITRPLSSPNMEESGESLSSNWTMISSGEVRALSTEVSAPLCDSDDEFLSIPFGKSHEVFDMLLDASGIPRWDNTTSHVRQHSLTSSETPAQLETSVNACNYLRSTEFDVDSSNTCQDSSTPRAHKFSSVQLSSSSLSSNRQGSASPQKTFDSSRVTVVPSSVAKRKGKVSDFSTKEAKHLATSSLNPDSSHSKDITLPSGRTKFDPLPDVFDPELSQSDSEYDNVIIYENIHEGSLTEDYENIDDIRVQSLELPKQLSQRTKRSVRGPTKKMHQSIKQKKDVLPCASSHMEALQTQSQSEQLLDSDWTIISSGEVRAVQAGVNTTPCDSDAEYQTIPYEESQEVFDMPLDASGVLHCENTTSHIRRHSLTSSETPAQLEASVSEGPFKYLQSTEFNNLQQLLYRELRDYQKAGVIQVRPRAHIERDIKELAETAPSFPPPLPTPTRSRLKLHHKNKRDSN